MAADYLAIIRRSHAHESAPGQGDDRDGADRIAALDAERNEADRQAGRGYDNDPTAPSHAEFVEGQVETAKAVARHCEASRTDLAEYLKRFGFRLVEEMEESR